MGETYVECLVKRQALAADKILRVGMVVITAVFTVLTLLTFSILFLILALLAGAGTYFIRLYTDCEYEYLYLDKELTVDKVLAKSKRKRVTVLELERMEIMAPVHSYHLDAYQNRDRKTTDYSSGVAAEPDTRYMMYYEGGRKILLEPSERMIKAMKDAAPRKIFMD